MKIKLGSTYKTRDGRVVTIDKYDIDNKHGVYRYGGYLPGDVTSTWWHFTGRYTPFFFPDHSLDLVECLISPSGNFTDNNTNKVDYLIKEINQSMKTITNEMDAINRCLAKINKLKFQ